MRRGDLELIGPYVDAAIETIAADGMPQLEDYLARWAEVDRLDGRST